MSDFVSERQVGFPTPTIAHEGNPETNTLTVAGTLDATPTIDVSPFPYPERENAS